ncbi:MAG: lipopolysaccharide biosynthesis protein [Bacteroidaceae bacterium]|nr:lipopolysaccharide biosynthesis protein [Bacteroidaceae bacterium]
MKSKTVSGVIWTGMQKLGSTMLLFISTIVLARLLTPEDYGYIGMLAIFLAISLTFIDGGFGSALIQKKRPTHEDYSTIFYWNLFLSIFLYLILFFAAPYIARFYRLPLLCKILRVEGIVLIVNAIRIVQTNQLRKQLRFKKIATVDVSVAAVSLAVTIFLAWKGFGVWALVVQQLMVSVLTTSIYWLTGNWLPLLKFSKKSFKELFNFGGFILLSNLVNTFCNNIQGLLIGKLYTATTMGYYSKAHSTESLASNFISTVMDQVSYPVLAEAQNDMEVMRRMLKKFIGVLAYLTFPLMTLLILLAKPIFLLLYTERWLDSVPFFQILCFAGMAICLQGINYYAVAAIGKSNMMFRATLIKRSIGLLLVVLGLYFWKLNGLLVGVVLGSYVIYIVNACMVHKFIRYTLGQQFRDLLPVIIITAISGVVAYIVGNLMSGHIYLVACIQAVVFICVYLFLSIVMKLSAFIDSSDILKGFIRKHSGK